MVANDMHQLLKLIRLSITVKDQWLKVRENIATNIMCIFENRIDADEFVDIFDTSKSVFLFIDVLV